MKKFTTITLILITLYTISLTYPHPADASSKNAECQMLIKAARKGDLKEVIWLLKRGCDVNTFDKGGMTPLMGASYSGHLDVVNLLLDNDAAVNMMDTDPEGGFTSLMLATIQGRYAVVKVLLKNGANPNAKRKNGKTALMGAVENGYRAITVLLLNNGADVTITDNEGTTLYTLAKSAGNKKILKLLKEHGTPGFEE